MEAGTKHTKYLVFLSASSSSVHAPESCQSHRTSSSPPPPPTFPPSTRVTPPPLALFQLTVGCRPNSSRYPVLPPDAVLFRCSLRSMSLCFKGKKKRGRIITTARYLIHNLQPTQIHGHLEQAGAGGVLTRTSNFQKNNDKKSRLGVLVDRCHPREPASRPVLLALIWSRSQQETPSERRTKETSA